MQLQNDKITTLQTAIQTAYLDHTINSNLAYRPEFISNNYKLGKKVLVSIEEELQRCEEFCISVAFITKSGITPLLQTLKDLEQRNIPGKILTTNYLMFSEPEALEKLAGLKNIELKMFVTGAETGGFHTKGYIFREEEIYRIIIGSSNMTLSAITRNKEWNTKIVSTEQGELTQAVLQEFDELWKDEHSLAFEDFIDSYRQEYLNEKIIRKQKQQAVSEQVVELENYRLKPNKMQVAFVKNVMEMRAQHIDRALLLSSTGTGKSLASAFMLREMGTKRVLFVVHREQIAKQTMKSYKRVFGSSRTYGLLSGNSREFGSDFLFATMQMLSKEDILSHYSPEDFDVIILDECHHVGAESYQKIMRYFKPKFWLGMTASPDTNQYDIYSIFDHHIAYTNFTLYQKYTYEDVCRLLNWNKNLNAQNIGGYYYDSDTKTLPVFINYHKAEDAIAYEDRFVSEGHLIALSKHPRKITSSDAVHIYKQSEEDKNNRIFLFVRKNKDDNEAKEFYFLGEIFAEGNPRQIYMEKTKDNAFEIDYRLDVPVRSDIYDYIVSD